MTTTVESPRTATAPPLRFVWRSDTGLVLDHGKPMTADQAVTYLVTWNSLQRDRLEIRAADRIDSIPPHRSRAQKRTWTGAPVLPGQRCPSPAEIDLAEHRILNGGLTRWEHETLFRIARLRLGGRTNDALSQLDHLISLLAAGSDCARCGQRPCACADQDAEWGYRPGGGR